MSGTEKREHLDKFVEQKISAQELAQKFPDCACESAFSPPNSHGPVTDDEILRYFLTSESDVDASKKSHRKERRFRPRSLSRLYGKGMSVCRLNHASNGELENTAKMLHSIQTVKNPEIGGIVGVLDFPASAVRAIQDAPNEPACCVFETPLDLKVDMTYIRPSHADVVTSAHFPCKEDQHANKQIIYNQLLRLATKTHSENVTEVDLAQFLPDVMRTPTSDA